MPTPKKLTLFQAGSLAKDSPKQVKEEEQQMTAGSGLKCLELLKLQNRDGLLLKMCRVLLTGTAEWHSDKCCLTWKARVIQPKVSLFQLAVSVRPIEGIGFGLLPTPRVSMKNGPSQKEMDEGNPKRRIETEVAISTDQNGKRTGLVLQPDFVEFLQGYPRGWTNVEENGTQETKD